MSKGVELLLKAKKALVDVIGDFYPRNRK